MSLQCATLCLPILGGRKGGWEAEVGLSLVTKYKLPFSNFTINF